MAKLFWWITVFISCLVNSVSPFHMEEVGFLINKYYTGFQGEAESPWVIYQQFFSTDDELMLPCDASPYHISTSTGKFRNDFNGYHIATVNGGLSYILALPADMSDDEYKTFEITGDKLVPIIAPTSCKITTSIDDCKKCTYMTVTGYIANAQYEITIADMECWYCDYNHGPYDGMNYRHMLVENDDYSAGFKQGQVIGIANKDTHVSIRYKNKTVSLSELYGFESDIGLIDTSFDDVIRHKRAEEEATSSAQSLSNPS